MNAEIKARWVEALRSGKYQQGRAALRSLEERFCCLGVLCDLYSPSEWTTNGTTTNGTTRYFHRGSLSAFIGADFRAQMGLSDAEAWTLARMNDDGKSFSNIADYIEANL